MSCQKCFILRSSLNLCPPASELRRDDNRWYTNFSDKITICISSLYTELYVVWICFRIEPRKTSLENIRHTSHKTTEITWEQRCEVIPALRREGAARVFMFCGPLLQVSELLLKHSSSEAVRGVKALNPLYGPSSGRFWEVTFLCFKRCNIRVFNNVLSNTSPPFCVNQNILFIYLMTCSSLLCLLYESIHIRVFMEEKYFRFLSECWQRVNENTWHRL